MEKEITLKEIKEIARNKQMMKFLSPFHRKVIERLVQDEKIGNLGRGR